MNILLSPETQRLLEQRMQKSGYSNPDDAVRFALQSLDQVEADELDDQTLADIEQGLAEADRGETRPWEQVREELRARYLYPAPLATSQL
jgi:Arc/MetJ-type ribon-helix-helix transcriptional regulator